MRSTIFSKPAALVVVALLTPQRPMAAFPQKQLLGTAETNQPIRFEFNVGQADAGVDFAAQGKGVTLGLAFGQVWLALGDNARDTRPAILRLSFAGANGHPAFEALDPLAGVVNYFRGGDPNGWRTDAPTFGKVKYHAIYPGVDPVTYGNQQQLEFDLTVQPGSGPKQIALDFAGAKAVTIDANGDLLLEVGERVLREHKPIVYQETEQGRKTLSGKYVMRSATEAGIEVGTYDRSRPLVIDPLLGYSETFGGSVLNEGAGVAVDAAGNTYITGSAFSADFPLDNAFQSNYLGTQSAFVIKFDTNGAMVYSTYLGGGVLNDFTITGSAGMGIAVDPDDDAFVTGYTSATNFPTMNALQPTKEAASYSGRNAFITELNPAGNGLVYSTYLGGSNTDSATGIALDGSGEAVITGFTESSNFPTVHAAQPLYGGNGDGFVAKLSADGSMLVYSTFLGGTLYENEDLSAAGTGQPVGAVAADPSGNAYVTGLTYSTNFPIMNAFQTTNATAYYGADSAAFVTMLDPSGNFVYSTYFGGDLGDIGRAIGVDTHSNAYFGGNSTFGYLPTTNAAQALFGGSGGAFVGDGFLAALDHTGTNLMYCTYLGGSGDDQINGIAVRADGEVAVTGFTDSANFPLQNAVQPTGYQGMFNSPDGANTWYLSNTGLASGIIYAVQVDPLDSSVVYALTKNGFFVSTNGGADWSFATTGLGFVSPAYSGATGGLLAVDPVHGGTLYVACFDGVYKSTNGGGRWTSMSAGLPASPSYADVQTLTMDPNDPNTLYAGTYGNGVFKTVDGATSWNPLTNGLTVHDIQALAVDPANSANVYAGTESFGFGSQLFLSTNGGVSWTLDAGAPSGGVNALAATASGVYAVAGNDFSSPELAVTTNDGATWTPLFYGAGLKFTTLTTVAAQAPVLSIADAGADEALSWPTSFAGFILQSTPSLNPVHWQNVAQSVSTNGANFVVSVPMAGAQGYYRLLLTNSALAQPATLYLGTDQESGLGALQSTDGGQTWTVLGLEGDTINAIGVDPSNPDNIFAGLAGGRDSFVVTFTPSGQIDTASYLGGSEVDAGNAIAISSTNVFVVGTSASDDFPTTRASPSAIEKTKVQPREGRGKGSHRPHHSKEQESVAGSQSGACTSTEVKGAARSERD